MLFLINNPIILFFVVLIVGFMVFMIRKIINEFNLNRMLREKHGVMRVGNPDKGFKKRIGLLASTALAPVAVVAIILSVGTSNRVTPAGDILDVHNGTEVIELYESFQSKMSTYDLFNGFGFIQRDEMESIDSVPQEALDDSIVNAIYTSSGGSDDYSGTNNQVIGVDEMDNVVTDGKYMYSIHQNKVQVTLAYTVEDGADALSTYTEISYIDEETNCPTGYSVQGLYVDEEYLVVVGSEYEYECEEYADGVDLDAYYEYLYIDYWQGYNDNVKVYVYDKEDGLSLENEYTISGNLIGTRKIDDDLYVVTSQNLPLNDDNINVDEYLPYYEVSGVKVETEYEDIVYVDGTSPNSFTTFYALDLDHGQVDMEVILGDSGYNLYVSTNNIYLVGNIYYFAPFSDLLNVEEPVSDTKTAILKISITGASVEYASLGVVTGYTLNQFSMDEENGYLRIATTTGWWGSDINNRIFILDEDLNEVSRIENLGKPGETIKSVRFVGDYGYIVTFEQTDPFYIINLSDPEAPFKEGELEIPGFSSYLQPLNNNYMLGIGFGDNNGGTNGLKISIYDISDKTNPVVFDEVIFDYEEFGWAHSTATYEHKDLLVSLSKGIIALPFSTYSYTVEDGYGYNSGILVYDFDEVDGMTFAGYVQHDSDTNEEVYVYKSKFIENFFYTFSNKYIKVSTIDDPENIINEISID